MKAPHRRSPAAHPLTLHTGTRRSGTRQSDALRLNSLIIGSFRWFALLATLVPGALLAQAPPAVTLPLSEVHVLNSKHVGDDFTVMVALPYSYGTGTKTYPVVYTLDADMGFAGQAESLRLGSIGQEVPEVILVGQGYPSPSPGRVMSLRSRDYTPTQSQPPAAAGAGETPTGGAKQFLGFLREELQPFIEERFRTNGQKIFVGDSYGGLFGLYAMFHHPDSFDRYLIGSPSIWFDNEVTFSYEEAFAKTHEDLKAKVFFSVGFLEELPGVTDSESFRMVSNTRKMHHLLTERGYPSLELELVIFDDETHISVIPAAMNRGLRSLLTDLPK